MNGISRTLRRWASALRRQSRDVNDRPYVSDVIVESGVGLLLVNGMRRNAMTVSMYSEAAHHPTNMWVSVARSSFTHSLLTELGKFTFVALHCRQIEIALACAAETGRVKDKCAGLDLYETPDGFLFLRDSLASIACSVAHAVELGDHTIFIAKILHGDRNTRRTSLRQMLVSDLHQRC